MKKNKVIALSIKLPKDVVESFDKVWKKKYGGIIKSREAMMRLVIKEWVENDEGKKKKQ